MEKVIDISDVAHAWLNQTKKREVDSQGTMYFEGRNIHSCYGNSTPMARIYEAPGNKKGLILFDSNCRGEAIIEHKEVLYYTIPYTFKVINVRRVEITYEDSTIKHLRNINDLLVDIQNLSLKQSRAINYDYSDVLIRKALSIIDYCTWFRCKSAILACNLLEKSRKRILRDLLENSIRGEFFDKLSAWAIDHQVSLAKTRKERIEKSLKLLS